MPMLNPCRDVVIPLIILCPSCQLWWSHSLSTSPLLHGDSAAVTLTVIFIDSTMSINLELANSLLLSVKNFSGAAYICIHGLKIAFRMTSGSFDLTKLDTDNPVAWSIKCSKILPL